MSSHNNNVVLHSIYMLYIRTDNAKISQAQSVGYVFKKWFTVSGHYQFCETYIDPLTMPTYTVMTLAIQQT